MIYHQGALLMRGAELSPSAEQAQHILCADLTLCEGNSVPHKARPHTRRGRAHKM